MLRAFLRLALGCGWIDCMACEEAQTIGTAPARPFRAFQGEVYPVLLRDCGFPACHGNEERAFRIFGPGRLRLPGETAIPDALDQPTLDEVRISSRYARAMINPEDPQSSPLLRKPLAVEAGGAGHLGVDPFDRDVYRTTEDSGYVVIARWVTTVPEAENP